MAKETVNYRKLHEELEAILARLETNELEVEEAIKQYQRGSEIVKQLQQYLKTAENKVKKVTTERSA